MYAGLHGDMQMGGIKSPPDNKTNGWFPVGQTTDVEPTGVLPGAVLTWHAEGRLFVPPQCGISTQFVASVVGETWISGFAWYEKKITLE